MLSTHEKRSRGKESPSIAAGEGHGDMAAQRDPIRADLPPVTVVAVSPICTTNARSRHPKRRERAGVTLCVAGPSRGCLGSGSEHLSYHATRKLVPGVHTLEGANAAEWRSRLRRRRGNLRGRRL